MQLVPTGFHDYCYIVVEAETQINSRSRMNLTAITIHVIISLFMELHTLEFLHQPNIVCYVQIMIGDVRWICE